MIKIKARVMALLGMAFLVAAAQVWAAPGKIEDMKHNGGKIGAYYALLIGIDDYQDTSIPSAKSSSRAVNELAGILKTSYGFKTTLLLDSKATKDAIVNAIQSISGKVRLNDSVVIFFSGRGGMDSSGSEGFWYPVDAKSGDVQTYVANDQVQGLIRDMKANDVLLISDSVYVDTFFGSTHKMPKEIGPDYYLGLYNKQSRWGLSSGTTGPTSGKLSVFSEKIILTLKENVKPQYSLQELYEKIKPDIRKGADRPPRCRSLRNTGDHGGELVFVLTPAALEKVAAKGDKTDDKKGKGTKDKSIGDSKLNVAVNVDNATVIMDGVVLGKGAISNMVVPPGMHQIVINKDGYVPFKKNVLVKRGEAVALNADLVKQEVKSTKGNLKVAVTPENATVTFTSVKMAYSPGMLVEKGMYTIEVTAPFHDKKTREVVVKPREENTYSVVLEPVKVIRHSVLGNFILINPGTFKMGSPDSESAMRNINETQHNVTLTKRFYIQEKEFTLGQWRWFIKASNYKTEAEAGEGAHVLVDYNWEKDGEYNWGIPGFKQTDDHPVVCVSWNDTQAFIKWMNKTNKDPIKYRLPTEAEWEYACRAGSKDRFSFGHCLSRQQANFEGNAKWENCPVGPSSKGTVPTGSFPANAWGLYDMHGNAMEWCQDWLGNYPAGDSTDPKGPGSGTIKVVRGGGWTSYAYNSRSAKRYSRSPESSYSDMGFRLVLEP
jgi:formylglycine-generating enzyme required for sulfatase activity